MAETHVDPCRSVALNVIDAIRYRHSQAPKFSYTENEENMLAQLSQALEQNNDVRSEQFFNDLGTSKTSSSAYIDVIDDFRKCYRENDFDGLVILWLQNMQWWNVRTIDMWNKHNPSNLNLGFQKNTATDGESSGIYYVFLIFSAIFMSIGFYRGVYMWVFPFLLSVAFAFFVRYVLLRIRFRPWERIGALAGLFVMVAASLYSYNIPRLGDWLIEADSGYPVTLVGVLLGYGLAYTADTQRVYRKRMAHVDSLPLFSFLTVQWNESTKRHECALYDDRGNVLDEWEEKSFFGNRKIDYYLGSVERKVVHRNTKKYIVFLRLASGRNTYTSKWILSKSFANFCPVTWEEVCSVIPDARAEAVQYFASNPTIAL